MKRAAATRKKENNAAKKLIALKDKLNFIYLKFSVKVL
jgi:hypothetical protein